MEENRAVEAVGMESGMERCECSARKDAVVCFISGKGQWSSWQMMTTL